MTHRRRIWLAAGLIAAYAAPAMAVTIDGRIEPQEWAEARRVNEFRKVQPLNGEPASQPTEVWILATPEGLAVAFRCIQPPSVPRTLQRVQRDFEEQVDRVNVMVDFDGDHRTGYDFTISSTNGIFDATITNETQFNSDWDGNWQHEVGSDDEAWTAEVLIPWHIAPMREAPGDVRKIGIYVDRVVGVTGERSAWPYASFERPRFLSDFEQIEVTQYKQSLLALTPYVSMLHDVVNDDDEPDAGLDVFWKPNGQTQLLATFNPDFGQVESDDLVVNFDATEVFISDKRPFFTENQGIFEFTSPSAFSQLLYTRRVGGPADDGQGAGDIIGAVKFNGSLGATKYGVFAAEEDEEAGRTFTALRLVRDFSTQNLGLMATNVDRPFLDRKATVLGVDHNWRPTARWNVRSRLIGSEIEQAGATSSDTGATVWADYEMDHGWRQQWILMYFGDELQINDAGFLDRNNMEYVHWQFNRRFTDLPPESRYASKDWRWRVSSVRNTQDQVLDYQFRVSRESRLRNGSFEYAQINVNSAGVDDLLTRGNGAVNLPPNFNSFFEYQRPRVGSWAFNVEAEAFSGGLSGNERVGYRVEVEPRYFISDALNLYVGVELQHTSDWLVWQQDTLFGSFDQHQTNLSAGFTWIMTNRHELRLKLQAIGLDADLRQAYRVDPSGNSIPTDEPVSDFSVSNLGLQIRYRYELAPLSYLYVVYGRGGFEQEEQSVGSDRLLRDSFSLRDDDQLLIKLSYRFET
jgi:hypothetical protein